MTDLSRDIVHQVVADGVTVASVPTAVGIWWWLDKVDLLLRIGVGAGSLVLIIFAIRVKMKQGSK